MHDDKPSSTSTTAAFIATHVDVDTHSFVADNHHQATFQVDAGPNPAVADLSWIFEESPPVGHFDSQNTAVETLKQYVVRQGFAISVSSSRSIIPKCRFLTCSQKKHYRKSHSRHTSMRDRAIKKVGCSYELLIMYVKHSLEESAWSTICVSKCHTGHSCCISETMLSALTAARRATREIDDTYSKVFQIQ